MPRPRKPTRDKHPGKPRKDIWSLANDGLHRFAMTSAPPYAELVDAIAETMAAGEWVTGKSWRILARWWFGADVSAKLSGCVRIRQAAAEASRRVRSMVPDDVFLEMIDQDLNTVVQLAFESRDLTAAVAALRTRLEARGLLRAKLDVRAEVDEIRRLSTAELEAEIRQLIPPAPAPALDTNGYPVAPAELDVDASSAAS